MQAIKKMTRLRPGRWGGTLLLGISLATAAAAAELVVPTSPRVFGRGQTTGHLIVHYRTTPTAALKSTAHLQVMSKTALMPLTYSRTLASGSHLLQLPQRLSVADAQKVAQRLARDPNVLYAEPSYPLHIDALPNDPLFPQQWALGSAGAGIKMASAWNITQGNPSVVMAVLDTGILENHVEFQGRLLPGFNFISDPVMAGNKTGRGADPSDTGDFCQDGQGFEPSSWHGSHVAGIMGGRAGNGVGIAGINPRSMILPVRVIGRCGGTESDTVDGLRWAAGLSVPGAPANPHPARVINMSMGETNPCPQELQLAINEVRARGAVVVVSAGNDTVNAASQFPANCKGVIDVAAVDATGNIAWFSNFGSIVTIAAPGVHILSSINAGQTLPTKDAYGYLDGTSQASPQVAGVLSLMLSINPHLTPVQVTDLLIKSRRPFPAGAKCTGICQAGLLDAASAVTLARQSLGSAAATPNDAASAPALVISAGAVQTLRPGVAANLHGSARTPAPAGIRSWRWQQLGGTHVLLSSTSVAQPRFVTPQTATVLVFRLTVTDSQNRVATATTQVKVAANGARAAVGAATAPASAPAAPAASAPAAGVAGALASLYSWMSSLF